jgi:uncharacterized protein YecE (DUF72 family)
MTTSLNIGTCSWKYESWQVIIHPENKPFNYLQEYSRHYKTVEVDQWFWSLFAGDKVVLPKSAVVKEYADSAPDDFIFALRFLTASLLRTTTRKRRQILWPLTLIFFL